MPAPPTASWRRSWVPAPGWLPGGRCSGPISALSSSVSPAFGLFGANLLQRLDLWRDASSLGLTMLAAVVVAPLSIVPAQRAGLVLIILEGVAVVAMVLMACAVLLLVAQGHGPQGDPPLRDLFIPTAGVGASAIALGLSFGLLSFAGFEQVATLGEEVKKSRFTIPRVLIGTVLGAGIVFTLVTAAETLGFGTDRAGVARFTTSTSLLADLSARYFGGWSGDLFDALAICSALGGALASIVAASRILFALGRDSFRRARWRGFPRRAGRPATPPSVSWSRRSSDMARCASSFDASGSDAFFWGSTLGALALLVAYLLVVLSAAGALMRPSGRGTAMASVHSRACGCGDRLHVLGERLPAPARRLSGDPMDRPGLVLCAGDGDALRSPAAQAGGVRLPGRAGTHESRIESPPRSRGRATRAPDALYRAAAFRNNLAVSSVLHSG